MSYTASSAASTPISLVASHTASATSIAPPFSLETVADAINTLYSPSTPNETRHAADIFLARFQGSLEAWSLSMQLLFSASPPLSSPTIRMLAAQTLKKKIVYDYAQLDMEQALHLKNSLWDLLLSSLPSASLNKTVSTQIVLALAALAVQSDEKVWSSPIEDALVYLEHEGSYKLMAEFLALIPEQLANPSIHLSQPFYQIQNQRLLKYYGDRLFQHFLGGLTPESSLTIVTVSLNGLLNWLKYSTISDSLLLQGSLLTAIANILLGDYREEDEILDAACEFFCELVYQVSKIPSSTADEAGKINEWLAMVVKVLQMLRPLLGLSADGNSTLSSSSLRKIAMIFGDTGQVFLPAFLSSPANMQILIEAMLAISERPELEVSETSFIFWEDLAAAITKNSSGGIESESMLQFYSPVFSRLFTALIVTHLCYPSDATDGILVGERLDAFREGRHAVGDCLKDCVSVLGGTVSLLLVKDLFDHLLQAPSMDIMAQWQPLEALLFALRTTSAAVDRRESEALPLLLPKLLELPRRPKKLVYAMVLVCGAYAEWFAYHGEWLPMTLDYVTAALVDNHDSENDEPKTTAMAEEIRAAAAVSLRYICESCDTIMTRYIDTMEVLYAKALPLLMPADQIDLTRALCHVLSQIKPTANLSPHYQKVLNVLATGLHAAIEESNSTNVAMIIDDYAALLEGITIPEDISGASSHPAINGFVSLMWPLLSGSVANLAASDPLVTSAICTCLRRAITSMALYLGPEFITTVYAVVGDLLGRCGSGEALYVIRCVIINDTKTYECQVPPPLLYLLEKATAMIEQQLSSSGFLADYFDLFKTALNYIPAMANDNTASLLILRAMKVSTALLVSTQLHAADLAALIAFTSQLVYSAAQDASLLKQQAFPAEMLSLFISILSATLTHLPLNLIGDVAYLLQRSTRLSSALKYPLAAFEGVLTGLSEDRFTKIEKEKWHGEFEKELQAARPRALKELLISIAQVVRRRI